MLLEWVPFGRCVHAIGSNGTATHLPGVRVARAKLMACAVSGLLTEIAAIVPTLRPMSGQPNAGGRGSVIGTLLGALLLGVLDNGLSMVGVTPCVQAAIKGTIILVAIAIGRERRAPGLEEQT